MYKQELERRLNKADYIRLPPELSLTAKYNDIVNNDDYKKMLNVGDRYGQKYFKFFKLKDGIDINTILSNLTIKVYSPNIPRITNDLKIALLTKYSQNFDIIANSYSQTSKWENVTDTKKEKVTVTVRRVSYITYDNSNKILTFSQDPIGEGAGISSEIPTYINNMFSGYNINFDDYFEVIDLLKPTCDLIDNGTFSSSKIQGTNQSSGRQYETIGKNKKDNLKDESIFKAFKNNSYTLDRMRLSHKDFKGTFEIFSGNIIRVWFNINGENTYELKRSITSVL